MIIIYLNRPPKKLPAASFNLSATPDAVASAIKSLISIFSLDVNFSIIIGIIGTMALTMAGDKPNFLAMSEPKMLLANWATGLLEAACLPVKSSIN